MKRLYLLQQYIRYLFRSKTKHSIHSPFIYDLVTNVLEDKRNFYAFESIEDLRAALLLSNDETNFNEIGAGSQVMRDDSRKVKDVVKYSAVKPKYGQLLFRLVNYFQPEYILELGTSAGISTAYLAAAKKTTTTFTLEGNESIADVAQQNFINLNLNNIKIYKGLFTETMPKALKEIESLDLTFIDGHHAKEPTIAYFNQCLPKIHNDSVIIFDDIYWSSEMTDAWESIKKHPNVRQTVDLFSFGIVFFRKEQTKQHFIVKY